MAMPQNRAATASQVEQRDPQPVLSVRASVPVADLAAAQGEALRALWSHLQQHGGRPAGPPFVRYHSFGETETDVEVGVPVAAGAVGEGRVTAGELAGGQVVSAWHLGAHDRLGDAYATLQAWLKEHGHQPAGPGWEVYHWIDLKQEPEPAAWPGPVDLAYPARPAHQVGGSPMVPPTPKATPATAEAFVARLEALSSPGERNKLQRHFKSGRGTDRSANIFLGVRMGDVFALAKEAIDLPPDQIDQLLASPIHEARAGGLSIMGKQASRKQTPERRRKELYELYLRRTDRINDWDLVDISAHQVIGGYLLDKPRDALYRLARSPRWWERRIAMFATLAFVRKGDLDDTFTLAGILVHDEHDLVQKVVGGVLREAGKHDRVRLLGFLDTHAATAPRVLLRYAIEHLDPDQRAHYLNLKAQPGRTSP